MIRLALFCAGVLFFGLLDSYGQADTLQYKIEGRKNSPQNIDKPYVILISIDGFRYDYAEKLGANNILNLGNSGVRAKAMIPSYPSNTFPNHYTIVTGMYPSRHGLIDNNFYDPYRSQFYGMRDTAAVRDQSWYGGLPIWGLAEKNKMVAASLFWVGSESNILNLSPSYYYRYHEAFTNQRKVEIVKTWLQLPEEVRPHLITLYFPEVDSNGHRFGPDSPETRSAVKNMDETIQLLVDEIDQLNLPNVNYILVSDHGMLKVDVDNPLSIPAFLDSDDFIVSNSSSSVRIHVKEAEKVWPTYQRLKKEKTKDYQVYLTSKTPKKWHYRSNTSGRLGEILLVPNPPLIFDDLRPTGRKKSPGTHGYDPRKVQEMKATFMAWGPAFKEGKRVGEFENVHVYSIISQILGLPYTHTIDGKTKIAKKILKK